MTRRREQMKNVSTGILDSLAAMGDDNKKPKEVTKGKEVKEKIKRSYMLTPEQIEKVVILKAKTREKDYSEIVGKAIELYYKTILGAGEDGEN